MKWLSNLKLRSQIMVMYGLLAAVTALGGAYSANNAILFTNSSDRVFASNFRSLEVLAELSTSYQRMRGDFMLMILARSQEEITKYSKGASEREVEMEKAMNEIAGLANKDQVDLVRSLEEKKKEFRKYRERIELLSLLGQLEEARTILFEDVDKLRSAMQEDIARISESTRKVAESDIAESRQTARATVFSSIAGPVMGFIVTIILGLLISGSVTKPLKKLNESIVNADLNTVFDSTRKDEVGDLMRSFDQFVVTIKETLLRVVEASTTVASAIAEISSSTEEMAVGAQQQTSQASDVSSGVEQLTRTISDNAKNAGGTAETAKTARETAEQGGKVVLESIQGMKRIADSVKQAGETVRALGKSSDQIGEIVSVIDDIADQTNLLALNAAIEAARAGEQGRGFAVVADEVRKLAERTTKATKEIADMIKKIQHDTRGAVVSMEQGTKEVDQGIRLADAAGNSLQEIVEISQKVMEKVMQIAAASEQQAGTSEEISRNVELISSVTRETATGIQQIAKTAEDVNKLTETLQRHIGRFKISFDREQIAGKQIQSSGTREELKYQTFGQGPGAKKGEENSRLAVRENGRLVPHSGA